MHFKNRGVVHSQIRCTDFKSSKKSLNLLNFFHIFYIFSDFRFFSDFSGFFWNNQNFFLKYKEFFWVLKSVQSIWDWTTPRLNMRFDLSILLWFKCAACALVWKTVCPEEQRSDGWWMFVLFFFLRFQTMDGSFHSSSRTWCYSAKCGMKGLV